MPIDSGFITIILFVLAPIIIAMILISFQRKKYEKGYGKMDYKAGYVWYLFPILFAIVGGLIGYFYMRRQNKKMAVTLLIIGVVMTILHIIRFYLF